MLLPVVPLFVKDELGGNNVAVGVVVGAFAVGAVLLRPFAGRIGDRMGRRVLIVGGAVIVGAAGLLYILASGVVSLVVVRVLAGIGEAAFFVGAASMITDLSPESRRGEAISYWSVAVYGGLAFGPLLGNVMLGRRPLRPRVAGVGRAGVPGRGHRPVHPRDRRAGQRAPAPATTGRR